MSAVIMYKRYGRRIRNSDWITPKQLTRKRWLRGVVTSVGDADNFRLFHTPPLGGYTWPLKFRSIPSLSKDLKDETIHIRIAGIDAPEAAHFGKPAQPYAAESLEWLRNNILGKSVYCQVLRKDQYTRIVAQVYLSPRILPGFLFHGKNVSAEMLKAGWAVTYQQAGAEYGHLGKDGFLRLENEAKAARRGIWKGGKSLETPSQYKRRHAAATTLEEAEAAKPRSTRLAPKKGWLRSLFTRS
ncbi:putative endonuclease lcl3 [Psilocybe cubensis]|nr:putative endonuclease lcl3 [Psilocybe cubensis]KAH9477145.1 putative endonuclease lcl3 [Psilocybe cubensis]